MTAKVKKIKVSLGDNEDLAEMFNQMLGTGTVNLAIAYPRYERIKDLCMRHIELFEIMNNTSLMKQPDFVTQHEQVAAFCANARDKVRAMFHIDLSEHRNRLDYSALDEPTKAAFTEAYNAMKRDDLIRTFVIMCDRIVPYRKNFEDPTKFNHKFITCMPGAEWSPFPFTSLNLKQVFSMMSVGKNTIMFFMTVLNKAYEFSRRLYDELQSPDIDVDQFVSIIMNSIDKIQNIPELHRCRDAFKKIRESVNMLKNNFNGYYRDFISSSDSTIIMQHFIIDVSKNTKANAKVAGQFRTIIAYYRKIAQEQTNNPKLKALFDKVNDQFKSLDKDTSNLGIKEVDVGTDVVPDELSSDNDNSIDLSIPTLAKTLDEI